MYNSSPILFPYDLFPFLSIFPLESLRSSWFYRRSVNGKIELAAHQSPAPCKYACVFSPTTSAHSTTLASIRSRHHAVPCHLPGHFKQLLPILICPELQKICGCFTGLLDGLPCFAYSNWGQNIHGVPSHHSSRLVLPGKLWKDTMWFSGAYCMDLATEPQWRTAINIHDPAWVWLDQQLLSCDRNKCFPFALFNLCLPQW